MTGMVGGRMPRQDVDLHPQVQTFKLAERRRTYQCPACHACVNLLPAPDGGHYACECGEKLNCTDLRGEK